MPTNTLYEDLTLADGPDFTTKLRAASIAMQMYGDQEMSDTLKLLSAQLTFDNNEEASKAIERTRKKLQTLIADRQMRGANAYITKITDEIVLEKTNGEVTESTHDLLTSSYLENGLFDPAIFGGNGKISIFDEDTERFAWSDYGKGMGYIDLPCRVVSASDHDIVARLLNMDTDELKKVLYYAKHVVIDPKESDLQKGQTLTDVELQEHKDDCVAGMGADAIYELLKDLNYADQPERMAYHLIPVIAPICRPMAYSVKKNIFVSDPLNAPYHRVLMRRKRLLKLQELEAPDIIIRNERRVLTELVDELNDAILNTMHAIMKARRKHKTSKTPADLQQLFFAARRNILAFEKQDIDRTAKIESLDLYPATIRLQTGKNKYEDIPLKDVDKRCTDTQYDFWQENIVVSEDEELTEEEQAQVEKAEEEYQMMTDTLNEILRLAKEQRENCVVTFDKEKNYYFPVTK